MLALYHGDTAVCAAKVRITLAEKQVPWEGRLLDLQKGEQFEPEYRKLNPNAVVPTLVHDDLVLIESTVINEYLDEAFPDRPLRPAGPAGRAHVHLWTKREDVIHDAINTATTALLFRPQELALTAEERAHRLASLPDPAKREKKRDLLDRGLDSGYVAAALARFARLWTDMERQLARSEYLAGERFSLADIGFISFFYRLEMLHADLWRERFPQVTRWFEAMRERPSFARGVTDHISAPKNNAYTTHAAPLAGRVREVFELALATI